MNQLISHIEFLLHEHNCVIVPDLGGFVVNSIPSKKDGISTFNVPSCELVFNRDLSHNDGLLAQSYMKTDGLSFEAASRKIEVAVDELKDHLRAQKHVELGTLGSFTMNDDKRFVYTPKKFVRPSLFGLGKASLKPLIQMQTATPVAKPENQKALIRHLGIGAAAAAAIALLMLILPFNDVPTDRQNAQIMSEMGWRKQKQQEQPAATLPATETEAVASENLQPSVEENGAPAVIQSKTQPSQTADFYVVMGVYERPDVAEQITKTLKEEGFSKTSWLERKGRIDVYVASFSSLSEAESYTAEIHKNYPNHRDAWVLKY